ncbi:MAG TPA: rhodanese-like domain-containing protein [Pyrinomonadaceae bacterium]|jgi:3-mercaptopyruvate sulfurtransferase SseA
MRLLFSLSAGIVLAVFLLAACNSTEQQHRAATNSGAKPPAASTNPGAPTPAAQTAPNTPSDGVRRMTTAELKDALDKGEAVVVDVRGESSYEAGHIKGARWIQTSDILVKSGELPRDKVIVTYCS